MMRICGKSTALSGFEVHDVFTLPCDIAIPMVRQDLFHTFAQHREGDTKAAVRGFGSGYRLKEQIYWRSTVNRRKLGRDVRQAARLRWNLVRFNQAVERRENVADRLG